MQTIVSCAALWSPVAVELPLWEGRGNGDELAAANARDSTTLPKRWLDATALQSAAHEISGQQLNSCPRSAAHRHPSAGAWPPLPRRAPAPRTPSRAADSSDT